MSLFKKIVSLLLAVFILAAVAGCGSLVKSKAAKEAESTPRVGFSKEALTDESEPEVMTEDDILDESMMADDYRGSWHFDKLSKDEQTVYVALEYALENGYTYVYVDEKLVSRSSILGEILEKLALDSPLLEQNLSYQTGEFTTYYEVESSSVEFSGYYIRVDNFEKAFWQKKMVAVKEAKKLIDTLPEGLSEVEIAEKLHRIMLDNIEYYDYSDRMDETVKTYLYDAFIEGATHCDGSANAYSLLLNLAGIECLEKQHTGDNTIGHTWNFAKLDGVWYNIDATSVDSRDEDDYKYRVRKLFGFSDEVQQYTPDYASEYAKAEQNLGMNINGRLDKINERTFVTEVKQAFRENGEDYACFIVYSYSESDTERAMQKLANSVDGSVYWITYEGEDDDHRDQVVLVVFKE